jgi:hypothetical protein
MRQDYRAEIRPIQKALSGLAWMPGFPSGTRQRAIVAGAVAAFADDRPQLSEQPGAASIVPLDWLITEIASSCVFFPKPIEMRRIYELQFSPLDGRSSSDLLSALEGC